MLSVTDGLDGQAPVCPGDPNCPSGTGSVGTGGTGTGATGGGGDPGGTGAQGGTGGIGTGGSGTGATGGTGGIIIVTGGTGGGGTGGRGTGGSGGTAGSGGSSGIGPCTVTGPCTPEGCVTLPCTPQQCVSRCHRFQLGGYVELSSSGRRCACESSARCANECADSICVREDLMGGSACETCLVRLALNPPEACLIHCGPDGGGCPQVGLCGINAKDCDELVACLKECPPL